MLIIFCCKFGFVFPSHSENSIILATVGFFFLLSFIHVNMSLTNRILFFSTQWQVAHLENRFTIALIKDPELFFLLISFEYGIFIYFVNVVFCYVTVFLFCSEFLLSLSSL